MKFLIVLSVFLVAATANKLQGNDAAHKKCQAEPATHVNETALDKFYEELRVRGDDAIAPPNFNNYSLCVAKQLNLVTGEGKANIEGVTSHVEHVVHEAEKIKSITKECAVDQSNVDATVSHIFECLYNNKVYTE